jgi:hypothetical protein
VKVRTFLTSTPDEGVICCGALSSNITTAIYQDVTNVTTTIIINTVKLGSTYSPIHQHSLNKDLLLVFRSTVVHPKSPRNVFNTSCIGCIAFNDIFTPPAASDLTFTPYHYAQSSQEMSFIASFQWESQGKVATLVGASFLRHRIWPSPSTTPPYPSLTIHLPW